MHFVKSAILVLLGITWGGLVQQTPNTAWFFTLTVALAALVTLWGIEYYSERHPQA